MKIEILLFALLLSSCAARHPYDHAQWGRMDYAEYVCADGSVSSRCNIFAAHGF
jgi:hypothetical protein